MRNLQTTAAAILLIALMAFIIVYGAAGQDMAFNGERTPEITPEITPDPNIGVIRGLVQDELFDPLAGAMIYVVDTVDGQSYTVYTGTNGRYQVEVESASTYIVRASADDVLTEYYDNAPDSASATPVYVPPGVVLDPIDFVLDYPRQLTGLVHNWDGTPLRIGAHITVYNADTMEIFAEADTTAAGWYWIDLLPDQRYIVRAMRDDYQTEYYPDVYTLEEATVIDTTIYDIYHADFQLDYEHFIGGVVTLEGGAPIPISRPIRMSAYDGVNSYSSDTVADGAFRLNVPPGDYIVHADNNLNDVVSEYYPGVPFHVLAETVQVPDVGGVMVDFHLDAPHTISGWALDFETGEPIADIFIGALAYSVDSGQVVAFDYPNLGEPYELSVPEGYAYYVRIEAQEQAYTQTYYDLAVTQADADPVMVPLDTDVPLDVRLLPASTISGVVYRFDGVTPISNARVEVREHPDPGTGVVSHVMTDADGAYHINVNGERQYIVSASAPMFTTIFYDGFRELPDATPIFVPLNSSRSGIDFSLPRHGAIGGQVTLAQTGAPAAGAEIILYRLPEYEWIGYMQTPANGEYHFDVTAGEYMVSATLTGYGTMIYDNEFILTDGTPIVVADSEIRDDIDFVFRRDATIRGTIYASDGVTPIADALVAISGINQMVREFARTNAAGQYELHVAGGSSNRLWVLADGYSFEYYPDSYSIYDAEIIIPPLNGTLDNIDMSLSFYPSNLIGNAQFSYGISNSAQPGNWYIFGEPANAIVAQREFGVFNFYRQPGTVQALLGQSIDILIPNKVDLELEILLANTSPTRKRVTILLYNNFFQDMRVCSFWLPPNSPFQTYRMQTQTSDVWNAPNIALYAATDDGMGWYAVDDVRLRVVDEGFEGTFCLDPNLPPLE